MHSDQILNPLVGKSTTTSITKDRKPWIKMTDIFAVHLFLHAADIEPECKIYEPSFFFFFFLNHHTEKHSHLLGPTETQEVGWQFVLRLYDASQSPKN